MMPRGSTRQSTAIRRPRQFMQDERITAHAAGDVPEDRPTEAHGGSREPYGRFVCTLDVRRPRAGPTYERGKRLRNLHRCIIPDRPRLGAVVGVGFDQRSRRESSSGSGTGTARVRKARGTRRAGE